MPKKQMIAKGCPKCEQQVPVASKTCRCGHSFMKSKKNTATAVSPNDTNRRRTQRVRREKPNYYDALEYDKQVKKTTRSRPSECDDEDMNTVKSIKPKKRKIKKDDEDDEEIISNMPADKQTQCLVILAELNRKMGMVTWKPS